jgi:hypothetical protein
MNITGNNTLPSLCLILSNLLKIEIRYSFDFCVGSEDESPVENLGQVLFGERIRPSPYKVC